MSLSDKNGVLVSTHPRSGTHLTIDLLRRHFPDLATRKRYFESLDGLYVPIDIAITCASMKVARARELVKRHRFPILKSHYLAVDYSNLDRSASNLRDWMSTNVRPVCVVRHPEKVLASYFLFLRSYGEIIEPTESWLVDTAIGWREHVKKWSAKPGTLTIRFEDLVRDTRKTLLCVGEHLGVEPAFHETTLPPRLTSKWKGRWIRCFKRDSPTTEILTGSMQGACFDDLFGPQARELVWNELGDLAITHGYSPMTREGSR